MSVERPLFRSAQIRAAAGYELLKDECDGATVAEGFNGNNTDLNEVTNWLKSQGYIND